jgi:predicted Na+-dependent transporter
MSPWIEIPLRLGAAALAFGLPGTLAACWIEPRWSWPMRLGVGVALSVLLVPLTAFCLACLLATSVTPGLTLGVAAGWSVIAALPLVRTGRRDRG